MKKFLVILFLLLGVSGYAADTATSGTVTVTREKSLQSGLSLVTIAWSSDGSSLTRASIGAIGGTLLRAVCAHGTATTGYSVVLSDQGGDVLTGGGAGLTTGSAKSIWPTVAAGNTSQTVQVPIFSDLTLAVDGAGTTKTGTIYLFIRP